MGFDLLIIVIVAACSAYLVYIMFDSKTEEEEIIQSRLKRINLDKESSDKQDSKKSDNLFEYIMSTYFEPIILSMNKDKFQNAGEEGPRDELKHMLMSAGKPYSNDDILRFKAQQAFTAMVCLLFGLAIGILLLRGNPLIFMLVFIFFGIGGFIGPKFSLSFQIKKRRSEIAYNLPDSLDLLVVCVEAGLGLDAALTRVAKEQARTAPVLAKEFGRVSKDCLAGVPRQDAFRNLALRNDVPELKSFIALLIQTDKLGTSIGQSLRVYADTVRTKRRQKAEKLAAEASVKMVIPLVLFILPSMFIVLMGPAAISLIKQFAGG